MGLFSALRPTPGKLITKALPLYLEETERPIASQAILAGSLSFGLNLSERPLITIVTARAITSGCIVSAHMTAKHLSRKDFSVSEAEYGAFRNSILQHVVGSIDPKKDKKIKQNKEEFLKIARTTEMAITDLSAENIWSNWDSPKIEEWKIGIAALYLEALNHCVDMGGKNLDEEDKKKLKMVIESYCINVGESHFGIFQTFMKEISDLMKAKGVCI